MKHLIAILGITALVWLGVAMSEEGEYIVGAKVEAVGYDALRYAVVRGDTTLSLRVKATGYAAFMHSLSGKPLHLKVEVQGEGLRQAVAVDQLGSELKSQMLDATLLDAGVDSIRVVLAPRCSRAYVPQLDGAEFAFADPYGLYGEPIVEPSEVMLYGSEEALAKIDGLKVEKCTIGGINQSGWHTLQLEPVWQQEADVKPSCTAVRVYVPVESYVERQYKVPITVSDADTSVTLRLYPPQATVNVWVAQCDVHKVPQLSVVLDYADIMDGKGRLAPSLVQFPSYLRLRSVEPDEVQCVIIK